MAKTVNGLINELQREANHLTSGSIPMKIGEDMVEVTPMLCGENGNYWCELRLKVGDKEIKFLGV